MSIGLHYRRQREGLAMSSKNGKRLTPAEALIMDAVWELSQATVREVQEHLAPV